MFTTLGFGTIVMTVFLLSASFPRLAVELDEITEESYELAQRMNEFDERIRAAEIAGNSSASEFAQLNQEMASLNEAADLLRTRMRNSSVFVKVAMDGIDFGSPTNTFVAGAIWLFVSYVVGQLSLALGRIYVFSKEKRHLMSTRIAKIAAFDNSVLNKELEETRALASMIAGFGALPIACLLAEMVKAINYEWSISAILVPTLFVTGLIASRNLLSHFGSELDNLILTYETQIGRKS